PALFLENVDKRFARFRLRRQMLLLVHLDVKLNVIGTAAGGGSHVSRRILGKSRGNTQQSCKNEFFHLRSLPFRKVPPRRNFDPSNRTPADNAGFPHKGLSSQLCTRWCGPAKAIRQVCLFWRVRQTTCQNP